MDHEVGASSSHRKSDGSYMHILFKATFLRTNQPIGPRSGLVVSKLGGLRLRGCDGGAQLLLLWADQEGNMPLFGIQVVTWVGRPRNRFDPESTPREIEARGPSAGLPRRIPAIHRLHDTRCLCGLCRVSIGNSQAMSELWASGSGVVCQCELIWRPVHLGDSATEFGL